MFHFVVTVLAIENDRFFFSSILCVCVCVLCRDGWGVPWSLPIVADSWDRLTEISVYPYNTETRWKSIWEACARPFASQ